MPKIGLLATIGLLVLLSGCSIQVTPDATNVVPNQNETTQTNVEGDTNTSTNTSSETISEDNETNESETGDIIRYSGVIKEYANGGYEDITHYIKNSDGEEIGIKVCDKPLMKFNEQIILSAKAQVPMDIFATKAERAGYCVYGLVANIDNQSQKKYTGLIKAYTNGGYGDITHYLVSNDGREYDLKLCDKRSLHIWEQALLFADTDAEVGLYSNANVGKAICVTGLSL